MKKENAQVAPVEPHVSQNAVKFPMWGKLMVASYKPLYFLLSAKNITGTMA